MAKDWLSDLVRKYVTVKGFSLFGNGFAVCRLFDWGRLAGHQWQFLSKIAHRRAIFAECSAVATLAGLGLSAGRKLAVLPVA